MGDDTAKRTGGEAEIRDELATTDRELGDPIADRPYSKDRRERRRGRFIDLHGDEDHDPDTDEATYRGSAGSTASTTSTTSAPSTLSTSSTPPTTSTTAPRSKR